MTPETRGRSRSRSDASARSKSGGSKTRRGKRDRTSSSGDVSVLSTASAAMDDKSVPEDSMEVAEDKHDKMETQMCVDDKKASPKKPKKLPVTVDTIVHRMRYLNYAPKPILHMKVTGDWSKHSLVAISRENGCIEVKSLDEKLRTIAVLPGKKGYPVHLLAWIKDSPDGDTPRLVGATRGGSIVVVNFSKLSFSDVTASGGGGVYALESLSDIPGCEKLVAAGCQDGSVRIFEHHENGTFLLVSSIPSSGAPVDSLAWIKRNKTGEGLDCLTIFAGVADGTIRRFDCSERNEKAVWKSITRMTVENRGRNIPTRVWVLQTLKDGTLVSGNSLGQVQFWDGETGALEQSIEQTETKADVLDIAVSANERKVFASGIDARVICVERQRGMEDSAWMLTQAQRPHTHDVKCVEMARKQTRQKDAEGNPVKIDILITGGTDIKICTYNVANFHRERPNTIYPWPTVSPVFIAGAARMVGVTREDQVDLYRVTDKREMTQLSNPIPVNEKDTLVGSIQIRHESNLTCAVMSDDGQYLAVANLKSCYLFSMSFKKWRLQTKQLEMEDDVKSPVSAMKFLSNTTLVLSCVDGSTMVVSLGGEDSKGRIQSISNPREDPDECPVHSIVTSPTGTRFATLRNSWKGGAVELYGAGEDGSVRHQWTLPSLDSPIADVVFLDESRIAVASIDFELVLFDINEQRLNQWNLSSGEEAQSLPLDLKKRRDYPVRVFPAAGNPDQVFMGGSGAFVVFQLDRPFPTNCRYFPEDHVRSKREAKRINSLPQKVRKEAENGPTAKICYQYNGMIYLGFLNDQEMVVVEEPWINVWNTLPAPLARRVYGS